MQAEAERTLNNLHVLAALSHNDKLMTNGDVFDIYSPTSLRALVRAWYGERRGANVQKIRQTVRAAINFASAYLEDVRTLTSAPDLDSNLRLRMDTVTLQYFRMIDALKLAHRGLTNLVQTYRDDAAFSSQLVLLNSEIDDFITIMTPHAAVLRQRCPHRAPGEEAGSFLGVLSEREER